MRRAYMCNARRVGSQGPSSWLRKTGLLSTTSTWTKSELREEGGRERAVNAEE